MNEIPAMAERIELWPTDRLLPYAGNARTHSDEQVAKVAASMVEFGFTNPILVDGKDGIIAGHCRLSAAQRIGLTQVPVVVLDHLSDAQRRAYILADNRLALDGGWDESILAAELARLQEDEFNLSLVGFTDEEMRDLLDGFADDMDGDGSGTAAGADEVVPEPPANPVSKTGDLWILGEHRLLCGSSLNPEDVIRLMNGERAILFATDPPYLVDYDGTNHPGSKESRKRESLNKDWSDSYGVTWDDSSQGPELYEGFIRSAIDHAIEPNAAWYCWHASKRQAMLEAVWEKMGAFQHQQIIWNKEKGVLTRSKYLWKHEPCLMGWIKGNMPPKINGAEFLSTVWDIRGLSGEERPDHPTPKPLDCFAIPMRQHVERGGLCYEPFSGSGSQIMAGEMTGRRVHAMEISPVYVDVAVKRFIQATGKIVYLDGSGGKSFEDVALERGIDLEAEPPG
ncbi:ParB domain protein nuclease [Magnetococcus marinus MC-1]|uniref:ParB domain protein nuclease n=1 Tax=Magnetococcus marinus (strain ATCC BAA-1437 / JCM 17883 / MC-1) TaxID=156889 RepID=A0L786_MAGMM|nr:ParB N-terminal domain-containing protein [Magnetococcus marinus]ABK43829.1 ParB domain protein nuclease [Magnetococcus marinus MC-1]ABK45082.1 ParB domain protein nuclease [Magnetococcus marinus MC-1]